VVRTFYKGACAVLLVYAIDSVSSFEALKHWTKEVKEHAHEQVCIFLVGTKLDLEARREVNRKDAERFMK
jgi:Ras-related protein Rab-13